MERRDHFTEADQRDLAPTEKMAIVSVADEQGRPHQALLSSLMASGPREAVIGEFTRGKSKDYMEARPQIGFLAMTMDRRLWRGSGSWREKRREGAEYEVFNKKPMFRYNTYFGVNTVHYLDLDWVEGPSPLPLGGIIAAKLGTMAALCLSPRAVRKDSGALSSFAAGLVDGLMSLNFLSWIDSGGEIAIVPVAQARSSGDGRLSFTPGPYGRELERVPDGAKASIFAFNMSMESILLLGSYRAKGRLGLASLDIEEVYNSMPPVMGTVWPRPELKPVREF
jgi:hypothetical protein